MKVDLFDFDLPDELIATEPVEPRENARLLRVPSSGGFEDQRVGDLPELLRPNDLLIFNDTKVIPAQLDGVRERVSGEGAPPVAIGATLHRRVADRRWHAFVRGARKLKDGDRIVFSKGEGRLNGTAVGRLADGSWVVDFDASSEGMIAGLERVGSMPLPPYITAKRETRASDAEDYQTVFAEREGAVAAPTAGLHFTPELLDLLNRRGVELANVTLHVGAGTFLPVKVDDTDDHLMHTEWGEIGSDTSARIAEARRSGGRVVAVGTTSLRVLEAAAGANGTLQPWSGETDIFITPGHRFRSADMLMTNFHLPRSTLFMLVAAFSGLETMRAAYHHAIRERYRFYSYGDTSLLSLRGGG